MHDTLSVVLLA